MDTFHAVLCLTLRNGLKMSEQKAYWRTGFPLIKQLGALRNNYCNLKKETNKYKEKLVSIGIIVRKQENKGGHVTYTTADILVGI